MRKIAFATYSKFPDLTEDDRTVIEHLQHHQIQVLPLIWDSDNQHIDDFESIIVRSCWDYHLKPLEFLKWIRRIEEQKIPLWNPGPVIRWNTDKIYLKQLSEKGVAIPPTVWLEQGSQPDLFVILEEQGWERAVIKPSISATAYQTWITSPASARSHQILLEKMLETSGAMVQKFIGEIQTRGEWSFLFFRKEYSHSVLKRARHGDFRVQNDFGGYLEHALAPRSLIEQAQQIVDFVKEELLFARVDGLIIDENFHLMELELIEPLLFLRQDPAAPQRLADAIAASLA
jgi:glutathione synthase/RimK-type ligase-like ATP-grasp enzyme